MWLRTNNIRDISALAELNELQELYLKDSELNSAAYAVHIPALEAKGISLEYDESTPLSTELITNYPNPFNPETWIPYQLATGGDIQISIYDINGMVVRSLDPGHQKAGYYVEKEEAAYWDGRSTTGERVSSGLYFYYLKTDGFSSVKRMTILK